MKTLIAPPARQPERVGSRPIPEIGAAPRARQAPPLVSIAPDGLDWLIAACADHLAAAPRPTRAALAAHLLASAGYRIADGFDEAARNMRVDLAEGIAARLLAREPAEIDA